MTGLALLNSTWFAPIQEVEVQIDDDPWQQAQLDTEQVRRFSCLVGQFLRVQQVSVTADHSGLAARQGRTRIPGRGQPSFRMCCGPTDLGALPGRPGEFAKW